MMHFVRTCSIIRAYGVRLIAIKEIRNYGKIVYTKNIFENSWREDVYPSSYPLDPPLAISYRNHQKSLAYFSHLAPFILFFFTKRQSQKGRAMAQCPPLNMLLDTVSPTTRLRCDNLELPWRYASEMDPTTCSPLRSTQHRK